MIWNCALSLFFPLGSILSFSSSFLSFQLQQKSQNLTELYSNVVECRPVSYRHLECLSLVSWYTEEWWRAIPKSHGSRIFITFERASLFISWSAGNSGASLVQVYLFRILTPILVEKLHLKTSCLFAVLTFVVFCPDFQVDFIIPLLWEVFFYLSLSWRNILITFLRQCLNWDPFLLLLMPHLQ